MRKTLLLAVVVLVMVVAILGILLVLDVVQAAAAKEILTKSMGVVAIIAIASIVVSFLLGVKKK